MPRKLISLSAAAASLAAVFAAAPAQALTVTSDAGGLKLVEPGFNRADVKLALVNAGGVKYRVETPNFGGSAITTGAGCVNQSSVGTAVALCQRINPKVSEVKFGTGRGTASRSLRTSPTRSRSTIRTAAPISTSWARGTTSAAAQAATRSPGAAATMTSRAPEARSMAARATTGCIPSGSASPPPA